MTNRLTKDKEQKKVPEKINVNDLRVIYSELFDDSYVPLPWDYSCYITKIGDILIGFGEPQYLNGALKKVKSKYGDVIKTVLIEYKKIPELSEPLVRRHGTLTAEAELVGKWIVFEDDLTEQPVIVRTEDTDTPHIILAEKAVGRPLVGKVRYVKGGYFIDKGERFILVSGAEGLSVEPYLEEIVKFFPGVEKVTLTAEKGPVKVYKVAKRLRIKVIVPLTEREKLFWEHFLPSEFDWSNITGDEYTNRNRNEPELWRPIH